jgi:uncharacterized protein
MSLEKPILAVKYIFNRDDPVFFEGRMESVSYYEDDDLKIPGGIVYTCKVWHVGQSIYLEGVSNAKIVHPCDRCLTPVTMSLTGKIEAIYVRKNPKYDGKTLKYNIEETDVDNLANLIYYDSDILDFSDRIAESILTEIPSKILCKEDCKGLCPICGVNWNYEKCEHYGKTNKVEVDPRFRILEKYKLNSGE